MVVAEIWGITLWVGTEQLSNCTDQVSYINIYVGGLYLPDYMFVCQNVMSKNGYEVLIL